MIRPSLMLTAALLAGCDQFDPDPPKRVTDVSTITIDVDPRLETPGWAEWRGNVCRITLRRYPECLAHEVRHCFEHDWHPGRRTGEDC